MAVYLLNSFSLNMLWPARAYTLKVTRLSLEEARNIIAREGFLSAIGHQETANFLSKLLGVEVPYYRTQVRLVPRDKALVFQLHIRLPEGTILSEDEVRKIYADGLASFYLVVAKEEEE